MSSTRSTGIQPPNPATDHLTCDTLRTQGPTRKIQPPSRSPNVRQLCQMPKKCRIPHKPYENTQKRNPRTRHLQIYHLVTTDPPGEVPESTRPTWRSTDVKRLGSIPLGSKKTCTVQHSLLAFAYFKWVFQVKASRLGYGVADAVFRMATYT